VTRFNRFALIAPVPGGLHEQTLLDKIIERESRGRDDIAAPIADIPK
jgi:hypothetical protein